MDEATLRANVASARAALGPLASAVGTKNASYQTALNALDSALSIYDYAVWLNEPSYRAMAAAAVGSATLSLETARAEYETALNAFEAAQENLKTAVAALNAFLNP